MLAGITRILLSCVTRRIYGTVSFLPSAAVVLLLFLCGWSPVLGFVALVWEDTWAHAFIKAVSMVGYVHLGGR